MHQVDLTTHRISTLPESQGLYSPRVSPDGRSLVALSTDSRRLMLFRFASQKWEQLALAENIAHPAWSRTGEHVYFNNSVESDTPFYRVRLSDHKVEHQGNVNIPRGMAAGQFGQWMGLAPDDSQILLHNASVEEIYALDVDLP